MEQWKILHFPLPAIGLPVYECSPSDGSCQVYDLLVRDRGDFLCMLSLFLLHSDRLGNPATFRLSLNDGHPFSGELWKMGFIRQDVQATFYIHRPEGFEQKGPLDWFLSIGDKDI